MAKRELIDREKAENTTWEEPSYTDALNVLTEVRDKIRELPVITEQEIVKPILDKIRAEIVKKHLSVIEKNDFESGRTYGYEEVLEIIDKYKAESEGKK